METGAGVREVRHALAARGHDAEVREFAEGTRTAADAARAIGCRVDQICKSLVFRGARSGTALLVIVSGAHRVDQASLAEAVGEPVVKADAEFVRQRTGFPVGGVPPVGHVEVLATFIDEDLLAHDEIWAAAGTPTTVFRLTGDALVAMTGGRVIPVE